MRLEPLSDDDVAAFDTSLLALVLVAGSAGETPNPLIDPGPPTRAARAGGAMTGIDERLHNLNHRLRERDHV